LGIDLSGVRAGDPAADEEDSPVSEAEGEAVATADDEEVVGEDVDEVVEAGELGMTDDPLATDIAYLDDAPAEPAAE
jgi:hypothetical protein